VRSATQTAGGLLTNNVFAAKSAKAPKGSTEAAVRNAKLTVGSGGKSASNVTNRAAESTEAAVGSYTEAVKSANWSAGSAEAAIGNGNRAAACGNNSITSPNVTAESFKRASESANRAVGSSNRATGSSDRGVKSANWEVKSANATKGSGEAAVRNVKGTPLESANRAVGSGGKSASNVTDQTAGVTPYRSNGMAEPRKRPRTISKAPISSVEPFGDDPLMRGRFVPDEIFSENYGEEYFDDEN
jgi:hypothetical protein